MTLVPRFSPRRLCLTQLAAADNMSDALAALTAIANCDCPERQPALDAFYAKWKDEPLVVDKWLGTAPWFFFIFLFFGIAAGFRNIYILAGKEMRNGGTDKDKRG